MYKTETQTELQQAFELCFESLCQAGKVLAFPCDATGTVPLDELSARARDNYLFARVVVGREFAAPVVRALSPA